MYVKDNLDNDLETSESLSNCVVNQATDDSPIVFGVLPENVKGLGDGFVAELYQCKRDPDDKAGNNLNIMHISTDLDAISDVIAEITDFLQLRGFFVTRMDVSKDYSEVDVLIIGGDQQHIDDVVKTVNVFSSIYGMFNRFDVLLYRLDEKTATGLSPLEDLPLTDKLFRFECMFAVYYNIRKWIDPVVNRGVIAERMVNIESYLDSVVDWNGKKESDRLSDILKQFKVNVKNDGHDDPNFEIFFAAMNTIRPVRNLILHGSHKKYSDDDHFRVKEFNKIVSKHGRDDLRINLTRNDSRSTMETMKDCIRLATYSYDWIKEYSKRYGQK